ncbi:MAG: GNAT family N-acetyltransferase [Aristaeellaceae bacterium]
MMNYRLAEPQDMDQLIDFANMVFSMVRVPHSFEQLLPKVYAAPHLQPDIHLLAEEDGRLCGCLGMLVYPLRVAGETLRVGYLGTMAVHPRLRGRGTMGALIDGQIARAREMELDMLLLGGQRQRYGLHGFESCGTTMDYTVSAANVRHAMAQVETQEIRFAPMQSQDVPFAHALYDSQPVAGARREDNFLAVAMSYGEKPILVTRQGEMLGYLITSQDGQRITELVMKDKAFILPAIKACLLENGLKVLHVEAAPHDEGLNSLLAPLCEHFSISQNCMLRMLNPERVIGAYMKLKAAGQPLEDGHLVLGCGEAGTVEITVHDGRSVVRQTSQRPELALDERQSALLLFGCNRFGIPREARNRTPGSWFPLPLYIPEPDCF